MDEEYICTCCLVTKQEIVDAVRDDNVTNIQDLRNITAATSGCGRCKIMCELIINAEISNS